jgi:hypothetical protein
MRENLGDFLKATGYSSVSTPLYCMAPSIHKLKYCLIQKDAINKFGIKQY